MMNRQLNWEHDVYYIGNLHYRYSVKCGDILHFFSLARHSFSTKIPAYDKHNRRRQMAMTGKWRILNHEDGDSTLFIEFISEFEGTTYNRVQSWFEKLFKMKGTHIDTKCFTTEDATEKYWIKDTDIIVEELYDNDCTCNEEELTQE